MSYLYYMQLVLPPFISLKQPHSVSIYIESLFGLVLSEYNKLIEIKIYLGNLEINLMAIFIHVKLRSQPYKRKANSLYLPMSLI